MISNEGIKKLEEDSKLGFYDEEIEEFKVKFKESIGRIEVLKDIDTQGVDPLYQVFDYKQDLREDLVDDEARLTRDEVLQNTKEKQYGYFKILNIME